MFSQKFLAKCNFGSDCAPTICITWALFPSLQLQKTCYVDILNIYTMTWTTLLKMTSQVPRTLSRDLCNARSVHSTSIPLCRLVDILDTPQYSTLIHYAGQLLHATCLGFKNSRLSVSKNYKWDRNVRKPLFLYYRSWYTTQVAWDCITISSLISSPDLCWSFLRNCLFISNTIMPKAVPELRLSTLLLSGTFSLTPYLSRANLNALMLKPSVSPPITNMTELWFV